LSGQGLQTADGWAKGPEDRAEKVLSLKGQSPQLTNFMNN